jgi:enoyl-CoA hydratase/carnithine racemase
MRLNTHCAVDDAGNGVTRLTITEAGKANILSSEVICALTDGIEYLAQQSGLRVLVITGSGERNFIGGADIKEMAALDGASAEAFIGRLSGLCESVRSFPTPVVARIQGPCLGGGLEFAMACDMRVAAPSAQFAMPEVRIGIPSVIHAALLPRFVGLGRARRMILTGEAIDAATALDWGLIDAVAGDAGLDSAVFEAIAPVLACSREVIAVQKALMRKWDELPLDEAIAASVKVFGHAFTTGDPKRKMLSFLAERQSRVRK